MTIDPKKIREIARVCAMLSKSAPTTEEHDVFANLALKWLTIARDREARLAVMDRFDDDDDAQSQRCCIRLKFVRRKGTGPKPIRNSRSCRGFNSLP